MEYKTARILDRQEGLSFPPQKSAALLRESLDDGGVSRLGLEVGIEQERVAGCTPRVWVTDTPDGDRHARGDGQASLDDSDIVVGCSVDNVKL